MEANNHNRKLLSLSTETFLRNRQIRAFENLQEDI